MKKNNTSKSQRDMLSVEHEKHQLRQDLHRMEREFGVRAAYLQRHFPKMALNSILPEPVQEETLLHRSYRLLKKTLQDESVQGKLMGLGLTLAEWILIRAGVPPLWNWLRRCGKPQGA